MTEEILDVVSDQDEIIGQASHQKVHQEKLTHRVAFALLFNKDHELLLQFRAATKSAYPSTWSFSMGGHVQHNETYEQAVVREAKEEVGIIISEKDLVFVGRGTLSEQSEATVWYQCYRIVYGGAIEEHTEEVDAVQFVTPATLREMIAKESEKMHPQTVEVLKKYFAKELGL